MTKRYEMPLTPEELSQIPDEAIDTSDIPELKEAFWAKANLHPPRIKPNVSLRVPPKVVEVFKAENPKGYTGRMAAVSQAYVEARQTK